MNVLVQIANKMRLEKKNVLHVCETDRLLKVTKGHFEIVEIKCQKHIMALEGRTKWGI
jgi:hypothetical protein